MFQCDCPPYNCAEKVDLYLAGDRAAGEELARKFTPLVHRLVQNVLGPTRRQDWDDACQAIFLRLFSKLEKWGGRCPFCKWLAVVAARRAIDFTRGPLPMEALPSDFPDARPALPEGEILARINQAIAQFPENWRIIWDMWAQGKTREEMADKVGKSVRTIQYWLAEMLDHVNERIV